jgi:hypothetical protein
MRRIAALLAIGALLAAPAAALAQEQRFTADLSADVEVPAPDVPGDYEGTGSATATVSEDGSQITYEVTFEGLTGPLTMAHIHWGATGETGPPIFWLTEQGVSGAESPLTGTLTEADFMPAEGGPQSYDEALEAMRDGNTYVNLHTDQNPPGEIRGQLTAAELPDTAMLEQPAAGHSVALWLALFGLIVLLAAVRRFAARVA